MKRIITNKAIFALTLLVGSMAMANDEGLSREDKKVVKKQTMKRRTAGYLVSGLSFLGLGSGFNHLDEIAQKCRWDDNTKLEYPKGTFMNTFQSHGIFRVARLAARTIGGMLLAPVVSLLPHYFAYKLPVRSAQKAELCRQEAKAHAQKVALALARMDNPTSATE